MILLLLPPRNHSAARASPPPEPQTSLPPHCSVPRASPRTLRPLTAVCHAWASPPPEPHTPLPPHCSVPRASPLSDHSRWVELTGHADLLLFRGAVQLRWPSDEASRPSLPPHTHSLQGLSSIDVHVHTSGPVVADRQSIMPLDTPPHTHTLQLPDQAHCWGEGGGEGGWTALNMHGSNGQLPIDVNWLRDQPAQCSRVLQHMVGPAHRGQLLLLSELSFNVQALIQAGW